MWRDGVDFCRRCARACDRSVYLCLLVGCRAADDYDDEEFLVFFTYATLLHMAPHYKKQQLRRIPTDIFKIIYFVSCFCVAGLCFFD